ncbi:MAG: hypothetical protein ACU837_13680 [Gammaproteobacteria bacterium]
MYANDMHPGDTRPTAPQPTAAATGSFTAKITSYLRWVGSLLIILSAVSFMLQGHANLLPAYRYWVGLGLTLLLCGGGLICAYLLKETKGARIFFGLGTAFVSVQVSQVSAMLYAYWHGQAALQPSYRWLQFMDVSPALIALDLAITTALLLLVGYAGYAVLARKHLPTLLQASILGNFLLLLPVRDGDWTALIAAALFVFLRQTELRLQRDRSMRLAEGLAARALLSLPLWLIAGRSLLHPLSVLQAMVLAAALCVYCIHDVKRYTQSAAAVYLCQWLGTLCAVAVWLLALQQFGTSADHYVAWLPAAMILYALSRRVAYHARLYRLLSAVLTVVLSYAAMLGAQSFAPLAAVAAGILLTVAGIAHREKSPFFCGNACVLGGFLFYWQYALDAYTASPWLSSIALGLAVILLASYVESKEKQIAEKSRYYFNELKNWD